MLHTLLFYNVSPLIYHWILAFHIISVVSWFAGLFYLPRLFVYHAMTKDRAVNNTFKIMEYKLNYYIMHPSMTLSLITGLVLMHFYFITHQLIPTWLLIKLALVLLLFIYQFYCNYYVRTFRRDRNTHSHRYFRLFNEIPTLLLIAIAILAVVQPFNG